MMMLSEIANALHANMSGLDVNVTSVGTDSRDIAKGQLFVGIRGEKFDGNTYAAKAIDQGASAVLVSETSILAEPAILVDDTRLALGDLAEYWRKKFSIPLVAVTGSNGKTTVKEMIAAILTSAGAEVLSTQGNLNNDIGMPLTLLKMQAKHTYAVIEMGMNHENEIRYLVNIAQPKVAVVVNAGTAHIGELGSREAIARAKGEIFEGLSNGGVAVINADDHFFDYWKGLNKDKNILSFGFKPSADVSAEFKLNSKGADIALKTPSGHVEFHLNLLGEHNVSNALAASAVVVALGISNEDIASGLSQFNNINGRLNWLEGIHGAVVIDDTYNANPDSMKAAIDVLVKQNAHCIFVMGDMAELGSGAEKMHADIGVYAKQKNVSRVLSLGELSQLASSAFGENGQHFESIETLDEALGAYMQDEVTVLVKGSRFMKMERIVNQIIKNTNLKGMD